MGSEGGGGSSTVCDDRIDDFPPSVFLTLAQGKKKKKHKKNFFKNPNGCRHILTFVPSRDGSRRRRRRQQGSLHSEQHLCLLDIVCSVGFTVSSSNSPPPTPAPPLLPSTPPCIHSNTHTCTKYVSCCILATGEVITERAEELACCRAADLIPASHSHEGTHLHSVAPHGTSAYVPSESEFRFFQSFDGRRRHMLTAQLLLRCFKNNPKKICVCLSCR